MIISVAATAEGIGGIQEKIGALKGDFDFVLQLFVAGDVSESYLNDLRTRADRIITGCDCGGSAVNFTAFAERAMELYDSDILVFQDDIFGNEAAARLALRADCDLLTGCDYLRVYGEEGGIVFGRNAYNCNMSAEHIYSGRRTVISLSSAGGKVQAPAWRNTSGAEVKAISYTAHSEEHILERQMLSRRSDSLENAERVVIGGRGARDKAAFEKLGAFAQSIGAELAGSRVAVNNGLIDHDCLVGMTGKRLNSELCLVIGASGASPLLAGLENVKTVIAVNRDEFAPIFQNCDYGIVSDYEPVLDLLIERLGGDR